MLDETWKSQEIEPEEFIERRDALIVSVRVASIGRESGVEVRANPAWVATFKGDTIASLTVFQSLEDALAETSE